MKKSTLKTWLICLILVIGISVLAIAISLFFEGQSLSSNFTGVIGLGLMTFGFINVVRKYISRKSIGEDRDENNKGKDGHRSEDPNS